MKICFELSSSENLSALDRNVQLIVASGLIQELKLLPEIEKYILLKTSSDIQSGNCPLYLQQLYETCLNYQDVVIDVKK